MCASIWQRAKRNGTFFFFWSASFLLFPFFLRLLRRCGVCVISGLCDAHGGSLFFLISCGQTLSIIISRLESINRAAKMLDHTRVENKTAVKKANKLRQNLGILYEEKKARNVEHPKRLTAFRSQPSITFDSGTISFTTIKEFYITSKRQLRVFTVPVNYQNKREGGAISCVKDNHDIVTETNGQRRKKKKVRYTMDRVSMSIVLFGRPSLFASPLYVSVLARHRPHRYRLTDHTRI